MGRRHTEELALFSLSFVDLIASALGAVLFLVLILAVSGRSEAERLGETAVRVDVAVNPGPPPTGGIAQVGGVPCTCRWFLFPPSESGWTGGPVPVEGRTGGPQLTALQTAELLTRAYVTDDPTRGWSTLWIEGARPGEWAIVTRLSAGDDAPAGAASVSVRTRVGQSEGRSYDILAEIRPGAVCRLGPADGTAQDAWTVTVPGEPKGQ